MHGQYPKTRRLLQARTKPVADWVENKKTHQPYSRDDKVRKTKERMGAVAYKKRQKAKPTASNDCVFVALEEDFWGGDSCRKIGRRIRSQIFLKPHSSRTLV